MHRRLSYANVTATLALFFAVSGGALAAKHYLITSPNQISPKVVKALKGNTGAAGARGATGAVGLPGKEGPSGKEGTPGKEGPQGKEGEVGSARAFAYITGTGEVSHAKNIGPGNIVHAGTSQLCIKGLSFTPENAVATVTVVASHNLIVSTSIGQQGVCPTGTQVTIATYNTAGEPTAGDVEVMLN